MAVALSLRPGDVSRHGGWRALCGALAASVIFCLLGGTASAQFDPNRATFVGVPPPNRNIPTASNSGDDPTAQMVLRADELQYDNANHRIIAVGNVQIYYKGSTLEANKVIYEQNTKRMHAEGNARMTEADGKVVHGEIIDLTDQFRDGFVDALQIED